MKFGFLQRSYFSHKWPLFISCTACILTYLSFRWLIFAEWWRIFLLTGIVAAVLGIVFLGLWRFSGLTYQGYFKWIAVFGINWYFTVFVISQIQKIL